MVQRSVVSRCEKGALLCVNRVGVFRAGFAGDRSKARYAQDAARIPPNVTVMFPRNIFVRCLIRARIFTGLTIRALM